MSVPDRPAPASGVSQGSQEQSGSTTDLADRIATLALATPGVAGLYGGAFGEVGTYLPGRRVAGVRLTAERCEVHVAVLPHTAPREVADGVRRAVHPLVERPVDVHVEDVAEAPEHDRGEAPGPA